MFHRTALLIAALLWTQTSLTSAGNILVYPVEGSRWVNMNIILKELNKRGHELTVVRSSMSLQIPENAPHYKSLTVQVTEAMDLDKPDQTALLLKNTIESKRSKWSILALIAAYQMLFNFMEQGLDFNLSEIFTSAFARLPQKVMWRHGGPKPSTVGNNTLILDWIPQNDLLGHPKTKVFITHGGTNGIYEAIYHRVPILAIPLILDQFDNVVRLKAKGIAEVLEVTELDVDALTQSLQNIVDEKQLYMENMRKISSLHHDTPLKPMDSIIFWLEFVMRHKGAAHLHTKSYKMPWFAYYNVDIFAFIITVFMIFFCFLV
ncbi:UDP glucuronosyltransferase 5 family, polypeptide E1 [Tachysurus ichikawai]